MIVEAIVCDDIREEVSGKLTLVGTYSEALLASQFPVLLPTFSVYWRVRGVHPLPKQIELIIESEIIGSSLSMEIELAKSPEELHGQEFVLTIPQKMAGIKVDEPGEFRFRVVSDRIEIFNSVFPVKLGQEPAAITD